MFAEEAPAAAGASTGTSTAAPDIAQSTQAESPIAGAPQPRNTNPLANVRYGRVEPEPTQQEQPTTETTRASFDDLINGDYKQDYQQRVQAAVNDRVKSARAREEKTSPILAALAEQYGKSADDIDGISEAFMSDPKRFERQALEQGISPETAARLDKLRRLEEQRKEQQARADKEAATQAHFQGLQRQAEEMKQMYPGFDLQRELQNEEFFKMTTPEGGLTVKQAYMALHGDEIAAAGMQYAVNRSRQKVAASVAANGRRPAEGGIQRTAPSDIKSDPTKLTKQDRAEIRRRVARGEKIVW